MADELPPPYSEQDPAEQQAKCRCRMINAIITDRDAMDAAEFAAQLAKCDPKTTGIALDSKPMPTSRHQLAEIAGIPPDACYFLTQQLLRIIFGAQNLIRIKNIHMYEHNYINMPSVDGIRAFRMLETCALQDIKINPSGAVYMPFKKEGKDRPGYVYFIAYNNRDFMMVYCDV
jgi:hypothetical protein